MSTHRVSLNVLYPLIAAIILAALWLVYLPGITTHAETSLALIGAGDSPSAVAVNPVTGRVYVANFDSNTVTVIDGAST